MKTLFISLLRAGDFIMQVPLIRDVAKNNEVHVLVNDEFGQLSELYPDFQFHFFPRQKLQVLINDQSASLLDPFMVLRNFLSQLELNHFSQVINLTHNRISAYIMDSFSCEIKKGLTFSGNSVLPLNNSWQAMFNKTFSENSRSEVHYLTALAKSLELKVPTVLAANDRSSSKDVYLQAFTSDQKKNWSLENWVQLHARLQRARPDLNFYFLASSAEAQKLSQVIDQKWIQECRLLEAREKLRSAAFFVTCDTSLSHLAAEVQTPMAVLSLGSSDYTKTMPWLHGTWVLSTNLSCSPCRHTQACQQESHICGVSLKVSTVLQVVVQALAGRFEMSVAYPERVLRMEMKINHGLIPTESSLTRRPNGDTEASAHLF